MGFQSCIYKHHTMLILSYKNILIDSLIYYCICLFINGIFPPFLLPQFHCWPIYVAVFPSISYFCLILSPSIPECLTPIFLSPHISLSSFSPSAGGINRTYNKVLINLWWQNQRKHICNAEEHWKKKKRQKRESVWRRKIKCRLELICRKNRTQCNRLGQ